MILSVKPNFEFLKMSALVITTLIWFSNSAFTFLSFFIKVFELIKKKFGSRKVEPEKINDKDLVISNLET